MTENHLFLTLKKYYIQKIYIVSSVFLNFLSNLLYLFFVFKGPGGYDFLSVNGQPLLSDINTGRFNGAHQPKLFLLQVRFLISIVRHSCLFIL